MFGAMRYDPAADAASVAMADSLTNEQRERLRTIARRADTSRVDVDTYLGRPAVICRQSREPLQFIMHASEQHIIWLLRGWEKALEDATRKVGG